MLHVQVDPRSAVPVYRQIMDQLKYYVASGTLKGGDQIPSIRDLAKTLRVNPTTVVKAYSELEHEGTIAIKHGKGAFIAEQASDISAAKREAMLRDAMKPVAAEAKQLGFTAAAAAKIMKDEIEHLEGPA